MSVPYPTTTYDPMEAVQLQGQSSARNLSNQNVAIERIREGAGQFTRGAQSVASDKRIYEQALVTRNAFVNYLNYLKSIDPEGFKKLAGEGDMNAVIPMPAKGRDNSAYLKNMNAYTSSLVQSMVDKGVLSYEQAKDIGTRAPFGSTVAKDVEPNVERARLRGLPAKAQAELDALGKPIEVATPSGLGSEGVSIPDTAGKAIPQESVQIGEGSSAPGLGGGLQYQKPVTTMVDKPGYEVPAKQKIAPSEPARTRGMFPDLDTGTEQVAAPPVDEQSFSKVMSKYPEIPAEQQALMRRGTGVQSEQEELAMNRLRADTRTSEAQAGLYEANADKAKRWQPGTGRGGVPKNPKLEALKESVAIDKEKLKTIDESIDALNTQYKSGMFDGDVQKERTKLLSDKQKALTSLSLSQERFNEAAGIATEKTPDEVSGIMEKVKVAQDGVPGAMRDDVEIGKITEELQPYAERLGEDLTVQNVRALFTKYKGDGMSTERILSILIDGFKKKISDNLSMYDEADRARRKNDTPLRPWTPGYPGYRVVPSSVNSETSRNRGQ